MIWSVLEAVGLSNVQEAAYRALLDLSPVSIHRLAECLIVTEAEAAQLAGALEMLGLVSRTPGRPPLLMAAPPNIALEALLARKEQDLQGVRAGMAELVTVYRFNGHQRRAAELLDIVRGQTAINECFAQIQQSARSEVRAFVRPPFAMPTGENATEFDVLARGVRCRAIYERRVLEMPDAAREIAGYMNAGEQARAVDRAPAKFVIADRDIALIPIEADQPGLETGAVLVHASALVEVMIELFEQVWAVATPLRPDSVAVDSADVHQPSPLADVDVQIVGLLLSGLSDKNVASQLGISLRTVQRRIHDLMELSQARTRMQFATRTRPSVCSYSRITSSRSTRCKC